MRKSIYGVFVIVTKSPHNYVYLSGEEIFTTKKEAERVADEDREELAKHKITADLEVKVMTLADWIHLQREISENEGYLRGSRE